MGKAGNRGADALIQTLASAGVKRIFTLSGNHIMPVFDAALDAGMELIHTRHEGAAVHMADAWARLTGEAGIAMVTGGPGHANAVSALYTAQMAESPVVLLSGHAPTRQLGMGAFQEMRQAELAAPVTKAAWTTNAPDSVATDIARALRIASSGRPGPVHLSLPTDTLELETNRPDNSPQRPDFAADPMSVEFTAAARFLETLAAAKRPLILCGPACMTAAGKARMAALEAASGIPVIGMESPRGIADPSLGAFAEMLAQADHVLLLGKRLDFTLKFGQAPSLHPDCKFTQIDAESAEPERTRRAVGERLLSTMQADAFSALETLTQAAQRSPGARSGWLQEVRAAVAYRPGSWNESRSGTRDRLHPVEALRPLQTILDAHPDSVLISDGGEFGQWAQACLSAPHRLINGVAGAIGPALPFALAARLAKPDAPVVAVMGDGTFGFHASEIDTAVRYKLPFICVIGNDARWNAEYQIQVREYGPERVIGCDLLPTRYDQVTAAFGGHGELVTAAEQILPASERARASGLPACLNILIEGFPAPNIRR